MRREIPLHTLAGVPHAEVTTHPYTTDDGLGLSMLRFLQAPSDDIVVIIHGLTTSSDMFIMPEHRNLVRFLHDSGFGDVWTIDFRMSNRFPYNLLPHRYTFDDVALFDFPPAIDLIRRVAGARRIHVICHCLGSVSFMMSLFGGAVTGISSVVANSVALTPRVPAWSRVKLRSAPFFVESVTGFQYLNPQWSEDPGMSRGKLFSRAVSMLHRECDVPACHMLSLMWGTGWPALYEHDNLADVTHRRGGDLYGATSMHYYRHVSRMVTAGSRPLKFAPDDPTYASLPDDYLDNARLIDTPVLFMTGRRNRVFTDSNIVCHERLRALGCSQHELAIIEGYGHQDTFMGKDCDRDVFPTITDFIERHGRDGTPRIAVPQPAMATAGARREPRCG